MEHTCREIFRHCKRLGGTFWQQQEVEAALFGATRDGPVEHICGGFFSMGFSCGPHSWRPVWLAQVRFTATGDTPLKATTIYCICVYVEPPAFFQICMYLRYALGSFRAPCRLFRFGCSVIVREDSVVLILGVAILACGAQQPRFPFWMLPKNLDFSLQGNSGRIDKTCPNQGVLNYKN